MVSLTTPVSVAVFDAGAALLSVPLCARPRAAVRSRTVVIENDFIFRILRGILQKSVQTVLLNL